MAKQFYFYDAAGTRRRVKNFFFYDSAGNRRSVKAGYFYDTQGNRRQFFAGGLQPPAQGYFPGSNFTMQAGENATNTGASVGSYGEIVPDAGAPSTFALYPTTDAAAHAADLFYANRLKTTGQFNLYYYLSPLTLPADTAKFWGFNLYDQQGVQLGSYSRINATETVNSANVEYIWPYIYPLTVGSQYRFMFHELAANTSIVAGTLSGITGFSDGQSGLGAFGSCANKNLTTRSGWTISQFNSDGESVLLALKGPAGATDPGKGFIVSVSTSLPSIGTKESGYADGYSWDNVNKVASWFWDDTGKFTSGTGYTLLLG